MAMTRLAIEVSSPGFRKTFLFDAGRASIGRDPGCDLWIEDPAMPRSMATVSLLPENPLPFISSADPLAVNGSPAQDLFLQPGDSFEAAGLAFRAWAESDSAGSPACGPAQEILPPNPESPAGQIPGPASGQPPEPCAELETCPPELPFAEQPEPEPEPEPVQAELSGGALADAQTPCPGPAGAPPEPCPEPLQCAAEPAFSEPVAVCVSGPRKGQTIGFAPGQNALTIQGRNGVAVIVNSPSGLRITVAGADPLALDKKPAEPGKRLALAGGSAFAYCGNVWIAF